MKSPLSATGRLAALAAVLALAVTLAACGSSSTATSGGTIGFSIPQGSNPALQDLDRGLREEATKQGLEVNTVDANLDPGKQISDVNTLIQQGVKVLVVWPLDDHAIQPAIKQAQAANIPVVALYTLSGGPYYTDLILDGKGVGRGAAEWFAKNLGKGAKVAAILGPPQVDQFRDISEGFKAGAARSGIDLVETQVDTKLLPENAVTLTQNFKQRYGSSLQGLFVTLEGQALGSASVVDGDFNPKIVTYGGTDDSIKGLKSGKFAISYVHNPALMGRMAGWAAGQALKQAKIPPKIYLEVPPRDKQAAQTFPTVEQQLTKPYDFKPVKRNGRWTMPLFE